MFVVGNFIAAIARILDLVLTLYLWIVVFRAVISWVNPDPYNPIVRFLERATEPLLAPLWRWTPLRGMGIDLSPILLIAAIYFLQVFLVRTLMQLAGTLH
ncbi:MAG: YggT family protein [Syntrophales bacterium]|nr:YggT family protein [Syntrophales bacterium]